MMGDQPITTRSSTPSRSAVDNAKAVVTRLTAKLADFVSKEQAAQAVTIIVACSRKRTEINKAEATIEIRQMGRLLEHYPVCVIDELTDPFRGISGKQKFVPSVAELKEFADGILRRHCDELRRSKCLIGQIESRPDPIDPQERKRRIARAAAVREQIEMAARQMDLRWAKGCGQARPR
jgi:hypothetical protein